MSNQSKRELVERLRHRYLKSSRTEKGRILDELVAVTGVHRKSAIRALRQGYGRGRERRGRPPQYTGATVSALVMVWRVAGEICGKRLAPFLPQLVQALERHGELRLDAGTRVQLLAMSAATIDRKLRRFRQPQGRGLTTTRPGTLLKQAIPVRTFADWNDVAPGFVEMDLVAHCGETTQGRYLNTLTATDVATGWTECLLLWHQSQNAVAAALEELQTRLPFPLLGVDCDNDGVFINSTLLRYCQGQEITFTRSRPYKKNDQAFVEQKNGNIVRHNIGYRRYTSTEAGALLQAIHRDLHTYVNFFQPMQKLVAKRRAGARVYKQYDPAQTPYQRVLASAPPEGRDRIRLQHEYVQANPAALRRRIDAMLKELWRLPE